MRSTRVTTVLLPLEPVTATTGARAARANNSISLTSGNSAAACLGRDADIQTQSGRNDHLGYSLQPPRMKALELDLQLRLRSCARLRAPAGSRGCRSPASPRRVRPGIAPPRVTVAPRPTTSVRLFDSEPLISSSHNCAAVLIGILQYSRERPLPDLQAGKADQHEDDRDNPETHDHLGFRPALEFEVVVQRGHSKNAPAGQLVGGNLDHD